MRNPTLKMTTVNLTEKFKKASDEEQIELEVLYTDLERFSEQTTEAQRAAAEAMALAKIKEGHRELQAVKFLRFASKYSEIVATEHNWMLPRRNVRGEIVIDNPLTRRDVLVAAKAQHSQMTRAAEAADLDEGDLFQPDEDNT